MAKVRVRTDVTTDLERPLSVKFQRFARSLERSLFEAADAGEVEWLKYAIESGVDVDERNDDGLTALILACEKGHFGCARLLVEIGHADVEKSTRFGETPLFVACRDGHDSIARLLIEYRADVDRETADDGTTPLSVACLNGHVRCAEILINGGADIYKATDDGETPLSAACLSGHIDCICLLLEKAKTTNSSTSTKRVRFAKGVRFF